jgi:hypothetical protein
MNWFANVGRYLWSAESTPYLTAAEDLTPSQARRELFLYAVLLGSFFGIVGLGGAIATLREPAALPVLWSAVCAAMIWACVGLVRLRGLLAAWMVALAPLVLLPQIARLSIQAGGFGIDQALMLLLVGAMLRYGWRVVRIVRRQLEGRPPAPDLPVHDRQRRGDQTQQQ